MAKGGRLYMLGSSLQKELLRVNYDMQKWVGHPSEKRTLEYDQR